VWKATGTAFPNVYRPSRSVARSFATHRSGAQEPGVRSAPRRTDRASAPRQQLIKPTLRRRLRGGSVPICVKRARTACLPHPFVFVPAVLRLPSDDGPTLRASRAPLVLPPFPLGVNPWRDGLCRRTVGGPPGSGQPHWWW
jgi:hypothetical protein